MMRLLIQEIRQKGDGHLIPKEFTTVPLEIESVKLYQLISGTRTITTRSSLITVSRCQWVTVSGISMVKGV